MTEWQNRPLDRVYPVMFIDAVHVKVRDGQVTNRPMYVAIGITVNGERDILGIWAGDGGEGAKFWLSVLTEIKNRGVADVCIVVCDGLRGIAGCDQHGVGTRCCADMRDSSDTQHIRFAARQYWDKVARDLKPVYTAPSKSAAKERFTEFCGTWSAVSGDRADVGERVERVRSVPRLRRRDPAGICSTNASPSTPDTDALRGRVGTSRRSASVTPPVKSTTRSTSGGCPRSPIGTESRRGWSAAGSQVRPPQKTTAREVIGVGGGHQRDDGGDRSCMRWCGFSPSRTIKPNHVA